MPKIGTELETLVMMKMNIHRPQTLPFSLELQMALLGAAEAFLALLWQFWRCKKIND